jgi:hypothetical protein
LLNLLFFHVPCQISGVFFHVPCRYLRDIFSKDWLEHHCSLG